MGNQIINDDDDHHQDNTIKNIVIQDQLDGESRDMSRPDNSSSHSTCNIDDDESNNIKHHHLNNSEHNTEDISSDEEFEDIELCIASKGNIFYSNKMIQLQQQQQQSSNVSTPIKISPITDADIMTPTSFDIQQQLPTEQPSFSQVDVEDVVSNVDSTSPCTSRSSSTIDDSTQTSSSSLINGGELDQKSILIIFSGLMVSLFLSSLDLTIVATALPAIVDDLGSLDQLSWVVTIYLLTSTSSSPLFGKFSDIFGRKAMLIFSLATFLVGSLLCATAYNMSMLIAARAIQGVGGGGLMSAVMIVMAEIVPLRQRGKYQGLIGAVYAVSSVVGPLMGGTFTDNVTWRWAFWINLPLGAIALAVVFFALNIPQEVIPLREGLKRIDFVGTLTLVVSVIGFLLALSWGGVTYPWQSPLILGLFGGTLFFLVLFVVNEMRFTKHPIIPMELFRNRNYIICSIGSFILGFIMFGVIYYVPLYFQMVEGMTATLSGLQLLPTMLGIVVMGAVSGLLITFFGHYKSYPIVGSVLMAIGTLLLSFWSSESSQAHYLGYQAFVGCGIGLTMQILVMIVQNSVDIKYISIATATISFFRTIGGVVGVSLFNAILNSQFQSNLETLVSTNPNIELGVPISHFHADMIKSYQGDDKALLIDAYARALCLVFLTATPFAIVSTVLTIFIKATKLRNTLIKRDDTPKSITSHDDDKSITNTNTTNKTNNNV